MRRKPDYTTKTGENMWFDTVEFATRWTCTLRDHRGESIIDGMGQTKQHAEQAAILNFLQSEKDADCL